MAEFVEVTKHQKRMCLSFALGCGGCGLSYEKNGHDIHCADFVSDYPDEAEEIIMAWASEHPEPKYPSWNEAWKQLFPNAYYCDDGTEVNSPCVKFFLPHAQVKCAGVTCGDCLKSPIPADIAKKLGIKPLEE